MADYRARSRAELEAIARAAESQLRRAEFLRRLQQTAQTEPTPQAIAEQVQPYIALSREAGVPAREIAEEISKQTGMPVWDKELLEYMAQSRNLPSTVLETLDETTANWMVDVVYKWLDQKAITHEQYVHLLTQTIILLACERPGIFIGRGAQFILPRDRGIAIRLVAPERHRIEWAMQALQRKREEAAQWVAETERARNGFIRTYFHAEPNDPHIYDALLNVARPGVMKTAEIILALFRSLVPQG